MTTSPQYNIVPLCHCSGRSCVQLYCLVVLSFFCCCFHAQPLPCLAKARAASVELGGRICQILQHPVPHDSVVPAPQCRKLALLSGADRPWLIDAMTSPPYARHSGPRPACRESEERASTMPIRIGHQKLVPKSVPAVRGPTNAKSQTRTSGMDVGCGQRSARRMSPAQRMNF